MRVNVGLCRGLAIAVLSMSAVVWLPQAASASPSLSVTASSSPGSAHTELTFVASGTAAKDSTLEVFAQDPAAGSCATTAVGETPSDGESIYRVLAGDFTQNGAIQVGNAGTYVVCGYLISSGSPDNEAPAAAATSGPVTVQDGTGTCPSGLSAPAVTSIAFHGYDTEGRFSAADITVHTSSPGAVKVQTSETNHNLGAGSPIEESPGTYVVELWNLFNRTSLHVSTAAYDISYEPDANDGCMSPSQPLTVTYYADTPAYDPATQGGGGVATYDGQSVPGSEPIIPDPSPSPEISGTSRVTSTDMCTVTVPRGNYVASYAWSVAGTTVSTKQTYTIPGSAVGKPLRCSVTVTSDTGATTSQGTSSAVTVKKGPALKNLLVPAITGTSSVGGEMHVLYNGDWSPKAKSYHYRWYAGSKRIAGATAKRYRVGKAVAGKKLSCKVTASSPGYAPGTATSKAVHVSK